MYFLYRVRYSSSSSCHRLVRTHTKPLGSANISQCILFSKPLQRHNPVTLWITCFFSTLNFGICPQAQWLISRRLLVSARPGDVTLSPQPPCEFVWFSSVCSNNFCSGSMSPSQSSRLAFGANRWEAGSDPQEVLEFVSRKIDDVLQGRQVDVSSPPPIPLLGSHLTKVSLCSFIFNLSQLLHSKAAKPRSVGTPSTRHLLHCGKRNAVTQSLSHTHPYIPGHLYPFIFPLYNPASVDLVVFWDIPSEQRSGHISISGITLGAEHAPMKEVIEVAETAKVKRSMYAETQRERVEILNAIRESEWNAEMNPVVLSLQSPGPLLHDFSQGFVEFGSSFEPWLTFFFSRPCRMSVPLILRNYSLTRKCRFLLRLSAGDSMSSS
jgi:hypothetical protein